MRSCILSVLALLAATRGEEGGPRDRLARADAAVAATPEGRASATRA
jgi:hypothetical protein